MAGSMKPSESVLDSTGSSTSIWPAQGGFLSEVEEDSPSATGSAQGVPVVLGEDEVDPRSIPVDSAVPAPGGKVGQ